jgi:hypothetical protein
VLVVLAQTVVPHAPPTRQILVLFNENRPAHLAASTALVSIETIALALVLATGALALARVRS